MYQTGRMSIPDDIDVAGPLRAVNRKKLWILGLAALVSAMVFV
jgi:hypothetical protein